MSIIEVRQSRTCLFIGENEHLETPMYINEIFS